jgi:aarF domain-containing kinase
MNGNAKVLTQDLKANSSTGMVISSTYAKTKLVQAPIDVSISKDSVRVLPSDEGFSWSKESYSATQRQIDIWSFVLALRARIWLLDVKWTYIGGFTEDKQVNTVLDFHWMSNSFSLENCFPLMFCIRFSVTAKP